MYQNETAIADLESMPAFVGEEGTNGIRPVQYPGRHLISAGMRVPAFELSEALVSAQELQYKMGGR